MSELLCYLYKNIAKSLKSIVSKYTRGGYKDLKYLLNNNKYDDFAVLILLYLGIDRTISITYQVIIKCLQSSEGVNRTHVIFEIANKLIRFAKYSKNGNSELCSKLNLSEEEIRIQIGKISEKGKLSLGQTLVIILTTKTSVFEEMMITEKGSREIIIRLKDDYVHKLNRGNIHFLNLPMLVRPNLATTDGLYLPYVLPESSHIYNPFDSIVHDKFDQKVKSESQGVLAKSINYLNSIPYRINKEVLEFLLTEWYNEDSLFFNGLNKLKEVSSLSKPLSGQDNRDILSHNSQYYKI